MLFLIIMRMLIYLFQYLIISKKYVLSLSQRLIRQLKEYLISSVKLFIMIMLMRLQSHLKFLNLQIHWQIMVS